VGWHHPGVRRLLAWALVLPAACLGVLVGHAIAYAVTGTAPGAVHDYLAHGPQIVLVLGVLALAAAVYPSRGPGIGAGPIASVALLGFVAQEHLERAVHSGHVPWLLTEPSFLVGLALQVPVALACIALVRLVAGPASAARGRPPAIPQIELEIEPIVACGVSTTRAPVPRGRAPPHRRMP
jgi:hypothetical protein